MLNKDKVDEVDDGLEAVKKERNLYIPRAVIKRLQSAHLMPFAGRTIIADGDRNSEAASALFYVVLGQPRASANSSKM